MSSSQSLHVFNFGENLEILICLDNLSLGSAIGGTRMIRYENLSHAIYDAKNLARAMTQKAAYHGMNHGGGKCVIYNPNQLSFDKIKPCFIEALNFLGGKFIAANDMGISLNMLNSIANDSEFLINHHKSFDDPSRYTALGNYYCIEKLVEKLLLKPKNEIVVKIQGLGGTGRHLCHLLLEQGYMVQGYDINPTCCTPFINHTGFTKLTSKNWFQSSCDIFAPCAQGDVINKQNVNQLNTRIICGCANNPVHQDAHISLKKQNILFIPDYISNGGGLIYAAMHYNHSSLSEINLQIQKIAQRLDRLDLKQDLDLQAQKIIEERLLAHA